MDPFQKYKSATLSTGDSIKKLIFVFDEMIKLLYLAKKSLGEQDYETKYKAISKVIDVFYILRTGVDHANGGEAIKTLDNFYISAIHNLEEANIKADKPEDLDQVLNAMLFVRDSIKSEIEIEPEAKNNEIIAEESFANLV